MNTRSMIFAISQLTLAVALFVAPVQAQQRYWVGLVSTDWQVPGNWSTNSGGTEGATVPTSVDNVLFDQANPPHHCLVTLPAAAKQLYITNGSLSLSKNVTLTVNDFSSITGGSLHLDTGTIVFKNNLTVNPAMVNLDGTVVFDGPGEQNVNYTGGTLTVYNLTINKASNAILRINSTDSLQVNGLVNLLAGQLMGSTFLKIEHDLWSHAAFGGTGIPIACTGAGTGTVTIDAPLAVTGPTPFVGIIKNSPSDTVNVIQSNPGDTIRIGNFNGSFFIRRGVFRFPANPPVISIFGTITIEPAGTLIAPRNFLYNGGRHKNTGGVFIANGGTYVFNQATVPAETDFSLNKETFNNLVIDIAGGQFNPGANDTLIALGTLRLKAGLLTGQAGSTLNVKGDFYFEDGMSPTQTNTHLILSGTTDQSIIFGPAAPARWNGDITVQKPVGKVILHSPLILDEFGGRKFHFLQGIVQARTENFLFFGNDYTAASANNNSYVDGPVRFKWFTTPFEFPIGNDGFYAPVRITDAQNIDTFTAQYFHSPSPFAGQPREPTLANISQVEWWQVNRINQPSGPPPHLWLSYDPQRSGGITSPNDLRVARWDGTTWTDKGASIVTPTFIRSNDQISEFSPFTLASTSALLNPLPIRLLTFTATAAERHNQINWTATGEDTADRYVLERSTDGINFQDIAVVRPLSGTSVNSYSHIDENASLTIYYRLRMEHQRTSLIYSRVIQIIRRAEQNLTVRVAGPSHSRNIPFQITGLNRSSQLLLEIVNSLGTVIYRQRLQGQYSINTTVILKAAASGIYFYVITEKSTKRRSTGKFLLD
ncbi:hypothetical protein [Paraflavitalea pollutisoli]|uniref:hypothetical protein n=1 Tax=Paraflavitalea pollutisoli TaxID=3034143 RepID=UPI0023EBED0D|nr:hypothetical protein [Paraflavitalea sp. H1-2-19X]